MSLYRAVKLLYSLTFSMLYFIYWNVLAYLIIRLMPDTRVFALGLVMVGLMQFLATKYTKKALVFFPSCIIGAVVLIVMHGFTDYLANIIYVVLNMFILAKEDENSIEYSTYRRKVMTGIYSLVAIGVVLLAVNVDFRIYLLRFYILFLISSIILLRESRRFRYNVKGKKPILNNLMVMVSVVVLTTDKIFNIISSVFYIFWTGISYVTGFLLVILIRLLIPIANYLESKVSRDPNKVKGMQPQELDYSNSFEDLIKMQGETVREISPQAVFMFKLIVLFIMAFIAYRLYKSYRYKGRNEFEGITEKREKITKEISKEKKSIVNTIKELFLEKDVKAQILKVYQSFEKKTYEKNIFKRHMTATQLYNVSKSYIDKSKPLKDITEIYNRAKFSKDNPSEVALREIRESYKDIKNQIDQVKN